MDTIIINNDKNKEKPQAQPEELKEKNAKAEEPAAEDKTFKTEKPTKRAGHNNTATILTSAGVSMVSGAGGAAGAMAYMNSQNQHPQDLDDEDEDEDETEGGEDNEGDENENENENEEGNQNGNGDDDDLSHLDGNDLDDDSDEGDDLDDFDSDLVDNEILPVDNGEPIDVDPIDNGDLVDNGNLVDNGEGLEPIEPVDNGEVATNNNGQDTPPPVDMDDVIPDEVAQELTSEIDENDIDGSGIFDVSSVETHYDEQGNEMQVAMIQTPDGGQFMMVDIDNDMSFDVITDMEGNPVAQVEAALTMSDVEEMLDEAGGYMAPTEHDNVELAQEVNVEEVDVVNTDGSGTDIAALESDEYDDTNIYPEDDPLLAENDILPDYEQGLDPNTDIYEV